MLLKYENIITYEIHKIQKIFIKFMNYDLDKINGAVVM
jgi:hypothetical protein